jgi:hypothetical protein
MTSKLRGETMGQKKGGSIMKKYAYLGSILLMATFLVQCATAPQRWPSYERRVEDRMASIQTRIGDGLVNGELTPNEGQGFLAKLDGIRDDYTTLRDTATTQEKWEELLGRLDTLESELDKTVAYPTRSDEIRIEDRMISIQRMIDEGRLSRRLNRMQWRNFQARLDAIRSEYFQMTKDRSLTTEEKTEISRQLDILEGEINKI